MDIMKPHGRGMAADTELTNALERINRTELALERTEQMLAENIALRKRMRSLVEAAHFVKIEQHQ
ncbi:hypothetical protein NKG99_24230 [Mesorhizobium sp. M1409]|uniref:hypothetical protein n=1 Tax=unclassified Mesorhizobium TaxID=325217 RepID=UPI00333CCAD8